MLNECLEQKRHDEAVRLATELRDALLREEHLDERQRKSLDGAESVIQCFSIGTKTVAAGGHQRARLIFWTLVAGLVVVGLGVYIYTRPAAAYERAVRAILTALEKVDAAVGSGVNLREYHQQVMQLQSTRGTFQGDYLDEKAQEVTYQAVVLAVKLHEEAVNDWARNKALSGAAISITDEPSKSAPYPVFWRLARAAKTVAQASLHHESINVSRDVNTVIGRLPGHWANDVTDLYYGNTGQPDVGWEVLKHHKTNLTIFAVYYITRAGEGEATLLRASWGHPQDEYTVTISNDGKEYVEEASGDRRPFKRVGQETLP